MARYDEDDSDLFDDGGGGGGDRLTGALLMLAGGTIFVATLGTMFYETERSFGHGLRAFQEKFILVLLFGVPVFSAGIWVYKWGKRLWKGRA